MKKLFFAIVVALTCVFTIVNAGDLMSFVPADSQAVIKVDASAVFSRPEAAKVLNDPAAVAKQLEFSAKAGCSLKDLKTAVIAVGNTGNGVILLEMAKKIDVAAGLKNLQAKVAESKVGKYTIYQNDMRSAICQVSDNVIMAGSPEDVKCALTEKRGISSAMQELFSKIAVKNGDAAMAVMVFDAGKSLKGSASYIIRKNNDHFIAGTLKFANREEAKQMSAMMPMYAGMFSGMFFGQNPELGAKVIKNFKVETSGSDVVLSINIPVALVDEISTYAAEQGKRTISAQAEAGVK